MKQQSLHPPEWRAPTREEVLSWVGSRVTDELGKPVGKVEDILSTGDRIEWLLVRHRHSHHLLAPVAGASEDGRSVLLPHPYERIARAPEIAPWRTADPATLARARQHYRLDASAADGS